MNFIEKIIFVALICFLLLASFTAGTFYELSIARSLSEHRLEKFQIWYDKKMEKYIPPPYKKTIERNHNLIEKFKG